MNQSSNEDKVYIPLDSLTSYSKEGIEINQSIRLRKSRSTSHECVEKYSAGGVVNQPGKAAVCTSKRPWRGSHSRIDVQIGARYATKQYIVVVIVVFQLGTLFVFCIVFKYCAYQLLMKTIYIYFLLFFFLFADYINTVIASLLPSSCFLLGILATLSRPTSGQ